MLQIVTDSSCDLPKELINKFNIKVVPLTINIDDKIYKEGVDITPEGFYEKMAQSARLPKTSQPPPAAFVEAFREGSNHGQVICLTISSKLSGTYQSACLAQELSGVDVSVFDTLAGSLGHGLQILKACELAKAGCTAREVMAELHKYRDEMKILVLLNTLENIVKGGRLSSFHGSLARILDIRLILHNVDGSVGLLEKVRGKKKFMEHVLKNIKEFCPDMTNRNVGITHFNNPIDAEIIKQNLKEECSPNDIIIHTMGSTMATYAGEGGMIVSF